MLDKRTFARNEVSEAILSYITRNVTEQVLND